MTQMPFDARPLVEPVDRAAVRAYARSARASGATTPGLASLTSFGVAFAAFGIIIAVMSILFVTLATSIASRGPAGPTPVPFFGFVPLLIVAIVIAVVVVIAVRMIRGQGERRYRLDRFARANGMSYLHSLSNPGLPGMIFGLGSGRTSTDLVRGDRPRFVEFANYRYTTRSGKNSTTHRWGYVAVKLDVPLPHIVLDAIGNNSLFGSNLPAAFDKDQRLSLEGDFDRFFSLYCPQGYERDALYLFTPDIMARFIDNAAALDVEIVDDWLFLYGQRDFSTLDAATWNWLFSVVAALLDKFAQWSRWRDERLARAEQAPALAPPVGEDAQPLPFTAPEGMLRPPPGVAPGGLRLKRRVPVITLVIVGGFVLFWIFSQFSVFASFLGR